MRKVQCLEGAGVRGRIYTVKSKADCQNHALHTVGVYVQNKEKTSGMMDESWEVSSYPI